MKTTNLTRKEAVLACFDGKKVGHVDSSLDGYYYKYDENDGFSLCKEGGDCFRHAVITERDGYFIYELEPTFKEVTMYAPVSKTSLAYVADTVYSTKEEALADSGNTIGYTEVKVYLKESEVDDE